MNPADLPPDVVQRLREWHDSSDCWADECCLTFLLEGNSDEPRPAVVHLLGRNDAPACGSQPASMTTVLPDVTCRYCLKSIEYDLAVIRLQRLEDSLNAPDPP